MPGAEISYKDLCSALPNFVHKDVLPAEIVDQKPVVAAAEVNEEPEDNNNDEDYEAPDAAVQMGEAFLDAFGDDSDEDDEPSPPPKKEEPKAAPVETKVEEEKQVAEAEPNATADDEAPRENG